MRARNAKDIGLLIRERRRKLTLDQAELARRVKVSRQWIVEIESGKPRAEIALVLRTLDALGLAVSVDVDTGSEANAGQREVVPSVDLDALLADMQAKRS